MEVTGAIEVTSLRLNSGFTEHFSLDIKEPFVKRMLNFSYLIQLYQPDALVA
jgi:hypothetical protein